MAGQIPLEPASMTIIQGMPAAGASRTGSGPSALGTAAQVWRTLLTCQAVAVAVKSCTASAALGLTVYVADSAVGGDYLMQTALEAIWADRSLLDKQDMPAALLAAAAAMEGGRRSAEELQQPAVHLQQAAVHQAEQCSSSSSNAGIAAAGAEDPQEAEEEGPGAVIDDYLLPPVVLQVTRPAVVYVHVPALPRG
jgi:hypothetical protein